jgi:hypothetical protein
MARLVLKKTQKKLNLAKWKGLCGESFSKLGYSSVDKFIEDVRGHEAAVSARSRKTRFRPRINADQH